MANNDNYNRNREEGTDNNKQSTSDVRGGELKNGRLSPFKNNHPDDKDIPNEYVNEKE